MRSGADQPVVKTNILARGHVRGIPTGLPTRLEAAGLTRERSMYLYKTVRPYLSAQYKDITCPMPEKLIYCSSRLIGSYGVSQFVKRTDGVGS